MKGRKKVNKEDLLDFYQEFPYYNTVFKNSKMKSVETRKHLLAHHKNLMFELRERGFSKKKARELCTQAINITKTTYTEPSLTDIRVQLGNEIEALILNLHKIPAIHRKFSTGKTFFLPSDKKVNGVSKYYYLKLKSEKYTTIENKEFNNIAIRLLKSAVANDITSRSELLLKFVNNKQVLDILDRLEEDLDSFIDIDCIKAVDETVNEQIFTQNYMYPGCRHGACATFTINKGADKDKAKEAAKFVLMHAINKRPLCIKEKELLDSIAEIEGRENNNNKYNNFLKKAVLYKQILSADPNYFQDDIGSFYTIEERKKFKRITVEDYLKSNGIDEIVELVTI